MHNASLFTRFAAILIDSLIVGIFSTIVGIFTGDQILGVGIGFLVGLFYNVYFWTSRAGQTPAKSLLSIRVVSKDGGAVTVLQAVIRYVGYYINTFVLLLGWLWAIVDGENEGLHDKLAGTRVVRA